MKKYRFILLYVILGCLSVSCNDWLDVNPETEQKEKEQFSSYRGFCTALTGCYMAMGNTDAYGQKLTMSHIESLAGLWYIKEESYGDQSADYYLKAHDYEQDAARKAIQAIYSKLFNIIVQANKIIANAKTNAGVFPDEATRSVIMGEAYAIRAYCQLDVLRLFGEVPGGSSGKVSLPYSEVTAFNDQSMRYDFDSYTEKLLSDLKQAETLLKDNDPVFSHTFEELNSPADIELDDTYMGYRQSRLNYWAVKALQARAYLYLGQKEEAYMTAKAVIDATDADGEPVMELTGDEDRTAGYNACPNECLFYLSKYDVKTVAQILIGGADVDARANNLYTTLDCLNELFPKNKDSDTRYTTGWNRNLKSYGRAGFAAIKKYWFADDAEDLALYYQIIPMLRMAEMYLIAIETTTDVEEANNLYADYLLYGCGVALDENAFDVQTKRTDILLPEYRREFFAEGQMFYAYKRTGASEMLWCDDKITDEVYVLWNCVNTEFNP